MSIPAGETTGSGGTAGLLGGPCTTWDPPTAWCCNLTGASAAVTGDALQAATEVLYNLSGQRFGLCEQTLRPCRRDCDDGWVGSGSYPQPALINGQWFNLVCGSCGDNCSCAFLSEALLPGPVYDITTVKVDGVELAPDDYRLDDFHILVRLGGEAWPWCNNLTLDDSEVGTWSVTARFGEPVPALGALAVGELACELAKLLACDSSCRLPAPLQSLNRQGISLTFIDPNEVFTDGRTGLYAPDLFIQTYNPHGLRGRARSYGLDSPTFRLTG